MDGKIVFDRVYGGYQFGSIPLNPKDILPVGVYEFVKRDDKMMFADVSFESDTDVALTDPRFTDIISEIDAFMAPGTEEKYRRLGFLHRRSLMLYGKPGVGKSNLIRRICKSAKERGVYVIYETSPRLTIEAIKIIKRNNPEAYFVVVWEDIEAWLNNGYFGVVLEMLDGGISVDRTLFIMTTNHIELIPSEITRRPSRLARAIEVTAPNDIARMEYISSRLQGICSDSEISALAKSTEGLVIDQVKDVIISVVCYSLSIEESVSRVRDGVFYSESDKMKILDKTKPPSPPNKDNFILVLEK